MGRKFDAFEKLNEQINNRIYELEKLYTEQINTVCNPIVNNAGNKLKFKTKRK